MTKHMMEEEEILQAYMDEVKRYHLLNAEEEAELSKKIMAGDKKALNALVNANLRLVVKIAGQFVKDDVSLMDIIQEGNMGLMHAAEKFDYHKKVRFSTYAGWWIRQFIGRYLTNRRRAIRLPYRKEEALRKIQRSYHALSQKLARQPRSDEIAAAAGVSVEDVETLMNMANPVSLDMECGGEAAVIIDTRLDYTYNPERIFMRKVNRREALRCMDQLKERERRILMYRYELGGCEHITLKKIGDKMGLSAETVRQIEMKALGKMKGRAEELRSCLGA